LKLAAQAEFGGIDRKAAVDARKETITKKEERQGKGAYGQSKGAQGWTAWIKRAVDAINQEQAAGSDLAPNDYLDRSSVTFAEIVARALGDQIAI
jgi:hypothetical protein